MAAEVKNDKYYTVDYVSKLSSNVGNKLRGLLDTVEERTAEWIKTDKWKHYKTVKNRAALKDDIGEFNDIAVYKLSDKTFYPKISIWKVEAYVPEPNSNKIFSYYNVPTIRTQFDNSTMSTFYGIPLHLNYNNIEEQKNDAQKSDKLSDNNNDLNCDNLLSSISSIFMNVCKTASMANGWISPRIFMNIVGIKYNELTEQYCTISTFVPQEMLNIEFKNILKINDNDLKTNVLGQNLSLYLGVKRVKNTDYSKVVYILQSNNGGWLPQWAVELGMVDQHMIAIFRKMTVWLLENKNKLQT